MVNTPNENWFFLGLFLGLAISAVVAGFYHLSRIDAVRDAAIDAGVASWVADPQSGQTTLKYGCPCQEKANE